MLTHFFLTLFLLLLYRFFPCPLIWLTLSSPDRAIRAIGSLQGHLNAISSQLDFLTQQTALMNQRSFGRKTEQLDQMHQITLFEVFNEPELLCDDSREPAVSEITVSSHARKAKSKREDNLEGLPARIFEHTLDDAKLAHLFPDGYKELPLEIYKRLSIIPQGRNQQLHVGIPER